MEHLIETGYLLTSVFLFSYLQHKYFNNSSPFLPPFPTIPCESSSYLQLATSLSDSLCTYILFTTHHLSLRLCIPTFYLHLTTSLSDHVYTYFLFTSHPTTMMTVVRAQSEVCFYLIPEFGRLLGYITPE